jgi:hypothetical protein
VNTDHLVAIKGTPKGSKIILAGVDSTENEQFVKESVEKILEIIKNK